MQNILAIFRVAQLNLPIQYNDLNIITKVMNKSKSEQQLPQTKQKPDFVCKAEDDAFIFQTKELFLQVQFKSPIKQIYEYLEQYEKYNFLAQISSVGIKASQQKQLYESINTHINSIYQRLLEKAIGYVELLIMNVHFLKFQKWHYFSQIIKGFKNNLLNIEIDCYNYNIAQFSQAKDKVLQYLNTSYETIDAVQANKMKQEIKANQKSIQRKVNEIHDNMFVKNPFKPENGKKIQVQSDLLFDSYMKKILYSTAQIQDAIDIKFEEAYGGIRKFSEHIVDSTIKCLSTASSILKEYNRYYQHQESCISMQIKQINRVKTYEREKKSNQMPPCIRSKTSTVTFSDEVVYIDEEEINCHSLIDTDDKQVEIKHGSQNVLQNRVPVNNPYFDIWDHSFDRQKLRNLHMFYEQPRALKPHRSTRFEAFPKLKKKLQQQKICYPNQKQFARLIKKRDLEEQKIWGVVKKSTNDYIKVNQIRPRNFQIQPRLNKIQEIQNKAITYKQYQLKYEKQQKNIDDLQRITIMKPIKSYLDYVTQFGIKNPKRDSSSTRICRYGIQIYKQVHQNTDLPKLEQFLCNFLKEKLFRESEKYKDRDAMPLILNTKSAGQFCNWRVIKKLGELTQSFKKYYIWASEIIKYEEIVGLNTQTSGHFTIYAYTNVKNSQSILFQLKRRLNIRVTGEVIVKHDYQEVSSAESVLSKLELLCHLLFGHTEAPSAKFSSIRGEHIFNKVVKWMSQESQ